MSGREPLQPSTPTKAKEMAIADYLNPVASGVPHPASGEEEVRYGHISPMGLKVAGRGKRNDSGVADLDHVSTEIPLQQSPGKASRPFSMAKTYDYADYASHQYEELPQTRVNNNHHKQMSPDSVDSHSSNGTSGVHSEGEENAENNQNGEQRKRYNPLYDTMINTSPTIYNKVNEVAKTRVDNHQRRQMCCLRVVIVLLFVISCTSLALCVVLLLNKSQTGSDVETLKSDLSELQTKFAAMNKKMQQLEKIVAGNKSFEYISDLDQKLENFESQTTRSISTLEQKMSNVSVQVVVNEDKIQSVFSNVTSNMVAMDSEIQEKLENISKMPGPQGPQGVGNLSACFMKRYLASGHESSPYTETDFGPTDDEIQTVVVMYALCQVENGEYHNLELNQVTQNKIKYRCKCSGASSDKTKNRVCLLHLWLCPRES